MTRAARGVVLVLAAVGFIWSVWLSGGGGGDINVLGLIVSSHDPLRPFTIGCAALTVFVLMGGRVPPRPAWWPGERVQVAALSLAVTVFGLVYATTAASGSDPYGYVSQADLWLAGDLHVEQPLVADAPWPSKSRSFAPLGYRPSDPDGTLVPTYPAGLALLMAGAKAVAGQEAVFWVVPLSGGLLVLVTYVIGVRLAPRGAAIVATWLMASCPALLYMLVQPMSDVPVAAAWLAACYLLLHRSVAAAAGAGLVAAIAVLIRPNLVFLVLILAAWPLWQSRARGGRSLALWQALVFCACASTGALGVALINQHLYGSAIEFGHGDVGVLFDRSHFWPNLVRYFSWLTESQTIAAAAGLAAILFPSRRLWPDQEQRRFLVMPAAAVLSLWLFYCFYLEFDAWWYLRFMLPVLPFVAIGTGAVVAAIRHGAGQRAPTLVVIALVLVVVTQYRFAVSSGTIDFWWGERRYVGVARLVSAETDERSVIFSLQHSGSMRYYGGRATLRFDNLDSGSLDEAVRWLSGRGIRSYLLVEEWEIATFRERFAGQATLERLGVPLAIYKGEKYPATLYDLSRNATSGVREIPNPIAGLRSVQPAHPSGLAQS